jgi:predicted RNase H-like nuclease
VLLGAARRVPYKVSRAAKYWPQETRPERIRRLLEQQQLILAALGKQISAIELLLPDPGDVRSYAELNQYEDALDALMCAWVGLGYLEGAALPYGDARASVWCPI